MFYFNFVRCPKIFQSEIYKENRRNVNLTSENRLGLQIKFLEIYRELIPIFPSNFELGKKTISAPTRK